MVGTGLSSVIVVVLTCRFSGLRKVMEASVVAHVVVTTFERGRAHGQGLGDLGAAHVSCVRDGI